MGTPSFPLTRPWVPVADADGVERRVGVDELFLSAGDVSISGTSAIEDAALTRMAVAMVYASGDYPRSDAEYASRVRHGHSYAGVAEWVRKRGFNLFGSSAFAQDPSLPSEGRESPIYLDNTAANNRPLLGDLRTGADGGAMPTEVAAVLLLAAQTFGITCRLRISSSLPGIAPRDNSGHGTSATSRALVHPAESTLARVLDLMVIPSDVEDDPYNYTWNIPGRARRTPPNYGRVGNGPADVYSWLGRRIKLIPSTDGSLVTGVVIADGDHLLLEAGKESRWVPDGVWMGKSWGRIGSGTTAFLNEVEIAAKAAEQTWSWVHHARRAGALVNVVRILGVEADQGRIVRRIADGHVPVLTGHALSIFHDLRNHADKVVRSGMSAAHVAMRSSACNPDADLVGGQPLKLSAKETLAGACFNPTAGLYAATRPLWDTTIEDLSRGGNTDEVVRRFVAGLGEEIATQVRLSTSPVTTKKDAALVDRLLAGSHRALLARTAKDEDWPLDAEGGLRRTADTLF